MSGGKYDYIHCKIEEFIEELELKNDAGIEIPQRVAFKELLCLVATAAHEIEWVDSGDCGEGDEIEAIEAVFEYCRGIAE